jgi:hypothetical protein
MTKANNENNTINEAKSLGPTRQNKRFVEGPNPVSPRVLIREENRIGKGGEKKEKSKKKQYHSM